MNCDAKLGDHIQARLSALVTDDRFIDALPGHMPGDAGSQARVPIIIQRLKAIAGLK